MSKTEHDRRVALAAIGTVVGGDGCPALSGPDAADRIQWARISLMQLVRAERATERLAAACILAGGAVALAVQVLVTLCK